MPARYENGIAAWDADASRIRVAFTLVNDSREYWRTPHVRMVAARGATLAEVSVPGPLPPGARADVELLASGPGQSGAWRCEIYPESDRRSRLVLDAFFDDGDAVQLRVATRTPAQSGRKRFLDGLARLPSAVGEFAQGLWEFAQELWEFAQGGWEFAQGLWKARALAWSLARRDLAARYRGSAGDALWAVLHPLLLMLLYLFVFGVVLRARFPGDSSTQGFALYFLAGMLPWLAMSDPIARAPNLLPEHRNYVKKIVFPLEILNVSHVLSALAAQGVALIVLLAIILMFKGTFPATLAWFPLLIVPQVLMTLGVAWIFSALGVFLRDLGQITGFLLTLVFFITPICYPESALPREWLWLFRKNPVDMLVRGWRAILIEQTAPPLMVVVGASLAAALSFGAGAAVYSRLRRSFADVL